MSKSFLHKYHFTVTRPDGRVDEFEAVSLSYYLAVNEVRKLFRSQFPFKCGNPTVEKCRIALKKKEVVREH